MGHSHLNRIKMLMKALVLVAVATVVYGQALPDVKAVAKASKEKREDDFRIDLDGGDSERECANARWEIKTGGKWVRVSERMYAKYFVAQKPKTYRFRLTIWDPKNKDRIDYDFVNVDIMGGKPDNGDDDPDKCPEKKCGYKPSPDVYADADILKVTETKNGYEIKLSGEDGKRCQDYLWEYKSKDGYIAIGTKMNMKYEVDKHGKHKFRLTCINNQFKEVDVDSTWVEIFKCKDPRYPDPEDNKGPEPDKCDNGKKHCDCCKGVNAKAKAEITDVKKKGSDYVIYLSAKNSQDCKSYEWERVRDKFDNEYIGEGVDQTYKVDKKGAYKFRVTCYNKKCHDSDSDNVESDCVARY